MTLCGTLSVESNMVNDSSFMHCHTGGVFMAAKLKKDRQTEPNPNDSHCGTLSVESNMVNDTSFRALSHWRRVYCSQIKKETDRQNLTLLTLNVKPCQLSPIWLMILSSEHCHTGGMFMAAKLKK